ncbi:dual specificity protein phosphatase family protein [Alloacidobacterium dinghuense]|uniref:Dual specificity protein phosphatase family protein n=1 Tax=Alloacidobacterium dinghuense TaxID=2763107 RepID=A0A7G8BGW0_9BACT|nr:dual specificity protein phosphatase family protein [Alloacidobacterium dinghuense]QNI31780.1 dual specificity protein phosphatase family protein [Alloacidobacterium dinghuense]
MRNIYWIQHDESPRLAIVARPRGEDWLPDEMLAVKSSGIDILVSLLEPDEAVYLGLEQEAEFAHNAGLEFVSFPIPDRATPQNMAKFCKLISDLTDAIRAGKHVGAHCQGCIGRSTVITASVMIELGWNAVDALRVIEKARGCTVPDTEAQKRWILQFTACSQS